MIEPEWLTVQEIRAIHNEIIAESGGEPGILNEGALQSTLNKPKNLFYYGENATLYQLAASIGYGLVKNHCFIDGNKRIALIAVYAFLFVNVIELDATEVDAVNTFINLAKSLNKQEEDLIFLAKWIRKNSFDLID